jgi:hypothetical protein
VSGGKAEGKRKFRREPCLSRIAASTNSVNWQTGVNAPAENGATYLGPTRPPMAAVRATPLVPQAPTGTDQQEGLP